MSTKFLYPAQKRRRRRPRAHNKGKSMTQIARKGRKGRKGNEGGRLPSVAETGDQGFPRRENPESVLCPHGRFPAQEAAFMGAVMTNQNADAPGPVCSTAFNVMSMNKRPYPDTDASPGNALSDPDRRKSLRASRARMLPPAPPASGPAGPATCPFAQPVRSRS